MNFFFHVFPKNQSSKTDTKSELNMIIPSNIYIYIHIIIPGKHIVIPSKNKIIPNKIEDIYDLIIFEDFIKMNSLNYKILKKNCQGHSGQIDTII